MGRSRELGEKDDRRKKDSPLSSFLSPLVLLSTALLPARELIRELKNHEDDCVDDDRK